MRLCSVKCPILKKAGRSIRLSSARLAAYLLDPIAKQNTLAVYDTSQGQTVILTSDGWQSYSSAPYTANDLTAFTWTSDGQGILAVDTDNMFSSWQFE